MCDLCDARPIDEAYTMADADHKDIRARLAGPPRRLQRGERWDGENILYSAGWLNDQGEIIPFEERS